MAPELIAQVLNDACQNDKLNFQIVLQDSILHIYINREVDNELDYTKLINNITDSLITLDQSWEGFWLYSRVMGEIEPDWQTYVELPVDSSDNQADPLIEQTEELIKEAKDSLEELKYLNDRDILSLQEIDISILDKDSNLLAIDSPNEVKNSSAEIEEEETEDPFAVEELDNSILDKNSNLIITESNDEVDNSQAEILEEEETEDLFVVEQLDDSILDKDSNLIITESNYGVNTSQEEIPTEATEEPFAVEELDEAVLNQNSFLLAIESADEIDNSQVEIEEEEAEDLFAVEELDEAVLDKDSNLIITESNDGANTSPEEREEEETEDPFAVEELDKAVLDKNPDPLAPESADEIDDPQAEIEEEDIEDPFSVEELAHKDNSENNSTETLNLSEYCFIRNQVLLESDLVAPKLNIAHLVSFFHNLSQENQFLLLPIVNQHFKLQEVICETQKTQLSSEIQDWLQQITELSSEETRKAAIWFSRYCFNPEKTMSEIQQVFDAEALKKLSEKQIEKTSVVPDQEQNSQEQPESTSANNKENQIIDPETETKRFSNYNMNLIVPIICLIVTLIFVILGVFLINSNSVDTEEQQSLLPEYYW